jgi:hypothetical protein
VYDVVGVSKASIEVEHKTPNARQTSKAAIDALNAMPVVESTPSEPLQWQLKTCRQVGKKMQHSRVDILFDCCSFISNRERN